MEFDVAVQILGWLGSALVVWAFWSPSDRKMAVALGFGLAAMGLHLGILGAGTAAAGCAVGAARSLAVLRWPGSRRMTLAFCAAGIALAIPTWNGLPSALALLAGTASTVLLMTVVGARLRLAMAGVSAIWLCHHALIGSVPALAMESLVAIGNLVTAARLLRVRAAAA